jgi:hypothetical protein
MKVYWVKRTKLKFASSFVLWKHRIQSLSCRHLDLIFREFSEFIQENVLLQSKPQSFILFLIPNSQSSYHLIPCKMCTRKVPINRRSTRLSMYWLQNILQYVSPALFNLYLNEGKNNQV